MSHSRKPLVLLVGAAVAAGSLLSMQAMAGGYIQDAANPEAKTSGEGKCGEGKCGEGTCGGDAPAAKGASFGKPNHGTHHGMTDMDTDKDGRMSRTEFDAAHKGSEEKFAARDLDGDGFVTQAEMDKHHASDSDASAGKGAKKAAAEGKCD